jgi:hypothetical protein
LPFPVEIRELRSRFGTYRPYRKRNTRLKNRIRFLAKVRLYDFTREEMFERNSRKKIGELSGNPVLKFRINWLADRLERDWREEGSLKELTSSTGMKGVRVFIATGIVAGIIEGAGLRIPNTLSRICGLPSDRPIQTRRLRSGGWTRRGGIRRRTM